MATSEPNSNAGATLTRGELTPPTADVSPPAWHADLAAIDVETDPASGQVLMLRHPTAPFTAEWQEADGFEGLARIANAYLTLVWSRLGLPSVWLADLKASIGDGVVKPSGHWRPYLGWLPFRKGDSEERRASFWAARFADAGSSPPTELIDRTAILLGGLFPSEKFSTPYFGQQAIRVVVHVDPVHGSRVPVRITGVSSTLPRWNFDIGLEPDIVARFSDGWTPSALSILKEVVQLGDVDVAEVGLRVSQLGEGERVRIVFDVLAKSTPRGGTAYAIGVRAVGREPEQLLFRTPLVANAVDARVFDQDPMSFHGPTHFHDVRPNRPSAKFDDATVWRQFSDLPAADNDGLVPLVDGWVRVRNSLLADPDESPDETKQVPDYVDEPARTNTAAAVNAYYHVRTLFDRMVAAGFSPDNYFEFATLPLLVRYRSGVTPGPGKDGNTVNAQVAQLPLPIARIVGGAITVPWEIEVRFALGDLRCSPHRQPLGIACDPRWCWHEFGHVLLAGAVNELEFRFAHSAGDALAAIVLDPDSKLAPGNSPWRGVTFPWVTSRRRHDRDVALGWGWNGEMYRRELFFAGPDECCKRGYWAEQILSSSLFRLYRAIGGDAEVTPGVVAPAVRQAASDYAVYLIMKAIKLIGPASLSPAKTPDQFVSALIDADIGSRVVFNVPPYSTGMHRRSPGTVHKVIRWSFERQGLYAYSPHNFPLARPGDPPPVDVYIDDGRHGQYHPISLLPGSWHARPASFWIRHNNDGHAGDQPPRPQRDNFVYLKVQNRGRRRANHVTVELWAASLAAPGAYPDFPGAGWQRVGAGIVKNVAAAGARPGEEVFGPYTWSKPQSGRSYALLAVATCADDRANSDPATGFLCADPAYPSPIAYLVACDNNLGLREIRV